MITMAALGARAAAVLTPKVFLVLGAGAFLIWWRIDGINDAKRELKAKFAIEVAQEKREEISRQLKVTEAALATTEKELGVLKEETLIIEAENNVYAERISKGEVAGCPATPDYTRRMQRVRVSR